MVGYASPHHDSGPIETVHGLTSFGDLAECRESFWNSVAQAVAPHNKWIRSFYSIFNGDPADEMFYRDDGVFRYYNVRPDGNMGSPILAGSGYTTGWDSITAVGLDGDGHDEMFFYRDDGVFRYYNIKPDGNIGSPILGGAATPPDGIRSLR